MAEIIVIFNPSARGERAVRIMEKVRAFHGSIDIRPTQGAGHARSLAMAAAKENPRIVVAAGGDGTVHEVANGLAGSSAALGILPLGTMNVFAREFNIPADPADAWNTILEGTIREIDLPAANGQYFVQLAGIGLDAQIIKNTSWKAKKALGPLSYILSAIPVALRSQPCLRLECNGKTLHCSFILVGNGRYYGSRVVLFPNAKPDDGKLDLVAFQNLNFFNTIRYLAGVFLRRHTKLAGVEYLQSEEAFVSSQNAVPVELDGELFGNTPVHFKVGEKLKVIVQSPSPPNF